MEKRSQKLSLSLGVTQKEISLLLGISRAQWSMFESGLRSLPYPASEIFGNMMKHVAEAKKAMHPSKMQLPENAVDLLRKLLLENKYQQEHVARALAIIQQQHDGILALPHVEEFFKANKQSTEKVQTSISDPLLYKKPTKQEQVCARELVKHEIELEVLRFEEKLIRERLGDI